MLSTLKKSLGALALVALLGSAGAAFAHEAPAANSANTVLIKQAATQDALRDLWIGHIFWVRNVALETIAGNSAAAKAAEAEVVANAKQIAASIEPFYGKAGSDALMDLLVEHYGAVKAHIDATAAGDADKQAAASKRLTANAGAIADFLSGANPNLPRATVNSLFIGHAAHHMEQDQQLKDGKYAEEAKTWAAMRDHMYVIADALTAAIAKQFPEKFN
ncbi:MAG TPA: hypothetical protein VFN25_01070 [Dokdonella sp.]|uniref:hypothetical protein n=1 Tax=Dokdonella sp. TaxID=2291710 RepID=UPI002D80A07B|nr:hypothetical protein [Dokdonella sp.]HET9031472.1 hypothetical protein [Dokdonella sp.]